MWLALSGGSRFGSQLPASPDYIGHKQRLYGNSREAADSIRFELMDQNRFYDQEERELSRELALLKVHAELVEGTIRL